MKKKDRAKTTSTQIPKPTFDPPPNPSTDNGDEYGWDEDEEKND